MKQNYYIFRGGRLRKKGNTLYVIREEEKKPIPVKNVDALFIFGEIDLNSKLLVFLAKNNIPLHVFNYYGFYSGTFYPREYLKSGFLIVKQVEHYLDSEKRLKLAKHFVEGATYNIIQNLLHYQKIGKNVGDAISSIKYEKGMLETMGSIPELMGCEGRIRDAYYSTFNEILRTFDFTERERKPPTNEINSLISFGNSMLYTEILSEIYKTQLNPMISYLHEPGERRFSLSLDLSEVFKPVLVDRCIFNLVNNRIIKDEHFRKELNACYLTEEGRKVFVQDFDNRLQTKVKLRKLGRTVSYKYLIRIECYKLVKHLLGESEYDPFRAEW
ncbi:MAG: type I-B CRISPR-associated endonuclease Cas1b [Candidatus Micrarchaeia archaeon]